jgi:threonyl-tRNA synthetase
MFILGKKETEERTISVRSRAGGDIGSRSRDELKKMLDGEFNPIG